MLSLWSGKAGFGKLGLISQAKKVGGRSLFLFDFELDPAALSAEYQETGSLSAKEARQTNLGRSGSLCMREDRSQSNPVVLSYTSLNQLFF